MFSNKAVIRAIIFVYIEAAILFEQNYMGYNKSGQMIVIQESGHFTRNFAVKLETNVHMYNA